MSAVPLNDVVEYLDDYLRVKQIPDYSNALNGLQVESDVWAAMRGVEAIVLAVRHAPYLELEPARVVKAVGKPCAIVDCFCMLDDEQIRRYFELGCEVKGMGRGHIQRIKESVRRKRR